MTWPTTGRRPISAEGQCLFQSGFTSAMPSKQVGRTVRFHVDDELNASGGPLQVVWITGSGAAGDRSGRVAVYLSHLREELHPGSAISRDRRPERSNPPRRLAIKTRIVPRFKV